MRDFIGLNGHTVQFSRSLTNRYAIWCGTDCAILDASVPGSDTAAGKILDTGFFNEAWKP